jgi:hypothetical protein
MNSLLLALSLFAADPPTEKPMPKGPDAPAADLKTVIEKLDALEKKITSINEQHTKLVDTMSQEIQKDLNDLNRRVKKLEADMESSRRQSTSAKPVEPVPTPGPGSGNATVLLINSRFDIMFEAVVNGVTYWVPPGQSRSVSVPAGAVSTELLTTQEAAKTRTLAAGATHVVTLR